MKTWIKRTLIGIAAAAALLGTFAAFSHGQHRHHGWRPMSEQDAAGLKSRVVERAGRELDLDEAQKARLGVLADRLREQRNALVGDTREPRAELQALIAGNTFDRARAQQLVQAKTGALQAKSPDVITALGDFYDGLRPDQQAKVRTLLERGRRGWHRD